jgi:hypothetical protein
VIPDRAAVTAAAFITADAGIAVLAGAPPWVAVVLALMACGALALFWRVPLLGDDGNDIEALVRATREDMPDHVPDQWTKEFNQ